jgi:hypothetical protein
MQKKVDPLCNLELLVTDPEVPDSIPGDTRFSETGPLSLLSTTEELLGRKSNGFCL